MKKIKRIEVEVCDICQEEVDDFAKIAEWTYTCSKCGKVACDKHIRNFHCDYDGGYFSLCTDCLKEMKIRNEREERLYIEENNEDDKDDE